jgi:quercetin dioxygenase-like cupin family protein
VTFAAGGASGKRTSRVPHDTFGLILAGTLVLSIEDETVVLTAGDAVYLPEHTACAWENQSPGDATLMLAGVSGLPTALISPSDNDAQLAS